MASVFALYIEMGNDAMLTSQDIAKALHDVAMKCESGVVQDTIRDANGNTVGKFRGSDDLPFELGNLDGLGPSAGAPSVTVVI